MNLEVTYGILKAHPGVHIRDRKRCFPQEEVVIELLVTDLIPRLGHRYRWKDLHQTEKC